jgi:hypothetical protein
MQKRKQIDDQTCIKLGPGRLGSQMETHNSHLHLQQVYYIQWQNEVSSWGKGDIVILGNRRNLRLLQSEHKHLRKNSCTASCSLL